LITDFSSEKVIMLDSTGDGFSDNNWLV